MALDAGNKIVNSNTGIVAESKDISGGYFAIDDLTHIPSYTCVTGALCYITAGENIGKFYRYSGTAWEEWKASVDVDGKSINLNTSSKLQMQGFETAPINRYPIVVQHDPENPKQIEWAQPLDQSALDAAVLAAQNSAQAAALSANESAGSASSASISAQNAQLINTQTMTWINNKFWWGTIEEYNALTTIYEGTFYFITLS